MYIDVEKMAQKKAAKAAEYFLRFILVFCALALQKITPIFQRLQHFLHFLQFILSQNNRTKVHIYIFITIR